MATPEIRFHDDKKNRLRLHEQLDLLTLPPKSRRRVMNRIAMDVRRDSKKNIRAQRTIRNRAMEPRKSKRRRRKMLMGLNKKMVTVHKGDLHAEVTWKNTFTGKIAYRHQHGVPENWSAHRARKAYGVPDYKKPATPAQAKSLIAEGYRRRVRKKRGKGCALKRVSQKWIRENLTLGKAGLILRLMREGKARGKQFWKVTPAARPFLGTTPENADALLTDLARQALREL